MERVHAAGEEIVRVSVAAGGVLSGEHGIGLEKRDLMPLMFSAVDLAAQAALRAAFDPDGLANPGKVLPSPAGCGDVQVARRCAEGVDLTAFADEVGADGSRHDHRSGDARRSGRRGAVRRRADRASTGSSRRR